MNYMYFYHILVDNIAKILLCDKTLSFVQNNKRNHDYFIQLHKNGPNGLIKQVYLLLLNVLHAFPSMSVSSLREFPENCAYKHDGFNCYIKQLLRKLLATNFSLMKLKVLKKCAFIGLFHPVSQELPKLAEKASLLTASGILLHAFPSMFVSSLDEFPENCVFLKTQ